MKIDGDLHEAIFIRRLNRFLAEIQREGSICLAHVPNTGRMKELLTEGTRVIVRYVHDDNRKTAYDLLMVYHGDIIVSIDSKLPNSLLERAFRDDWIQPYMGFTNIAREVKYGNSRLDFAVNNGTELAFVEAKCVTYVTEDKVASFPDAPTERGRKHIMELTHALHENIRTSVFFIVQREDAISFTPNRERDPKFAEAVLEASKAGVEFYAFICKVTPNEISLWKQIPIVL